MAVAPNAGGIYSRNLPSRLVSLYTRRRREFVVKLTERGFERTGAEHLMTEWEYEANRQGLDVTSAEFWRQAHQWIAEGPPAPEDR